MMTSSPKVATANPFNMLVIVAALGYFVDIYDLILFNVIKKESLELLKLAGDAYEAHEIFLFNCQMMGMLIGGVLWGILGDKKGRVKVLFGSILLYSLANVANAFVTDLPTYAAVRFIAGLGLAGELGAGITLVVESMQKERRGLGTMIIVTFGALGAVFASVVGRKGAVMASIVNTYLHTSLAGWQVAYLVGGILGLALLLLRVGTYESALFKNAHQSRQVLKGSFKLILKSKDNILKYMSCIFIGLPIWFIIGVLIALGAGLTRELGITGVTTAEAVMYAYLGLSVGDLLSGLFSQWFKNRRVVILVYLILSMFLTVVYLWPITATAQGYYFICFALGCGTGYWALFVTVASEQFGTNIRSTVANTVPNFVRGAVVPITISYKYLSSLLAVDQPKVMAAYIVGGVCTALALIGAYYIKDTFSKDLDYTE
jgi:MFS transporter, putative metabolite:H+ symporter